MGVPEAVVMQIPAEEGSPAARVPPRIRRRLLQVRGAPPASVEEIEAKLRNAHLRRQQFQQALSCKARRKLKSSSWLSQEEDLGQRLEAKLVAAKQKRLSLLAKAQNRLAKLDELRQAAKNDVEMRLEREREELGTRVESRVRQAEENRMQLLHARLQRQTALKERIERSLVQRVAWENRYKECVHSAILQKRTAAEKKRLGMLEAEKRRAHARLMQVQYVAKTVCSQRELERWKLKENLEDKLQRAKQQRAEYLRQHGIPHSAVRMNLIKHGDFLSRKLARCWRRFVRSRKTTVVLTRAYDVLEINQKSIESMPFEKLAFCIESPTVLQTTKALLDRLENRFLLSHSSSSSAVENIDHLLKHLGSQKRRAAPIRAETLGRTKVASTKAARSFEASKISRYSHRVVLCAHMIVAHQSTVFSGQGEREKLLVESATKFVKEFELLVKTILDGPDSACTLKQSSLDVSPGLSNCQESTSIVAGQKKFRSQLAAFDKAWCAYLYHFVVWKVKDAKTLEEDLVRAACKLELSMMQTCKLTAEGQSDTLSPDMKAIQKQVTEDQKLLREKVQHLSGDAGIERMESALSNARSKFFEAKENGSPPATTIASASSPLSTRSGESPLSEIKENSNTNVERPTCVVQSLSGASSSQSESSTRGKFTRVPSSSTVPEKMPTENEQMVNEMLHDIRRSFADNPDSIGAVEGDFKAKVRKTMEKAFWDVVADSMREDKPDYSQLVSLVKEVRDALHGLAPGGWKEEILNKIDLEILSQLLESGSQDTQYMGQILQYSLGMLRKLSSPAKEDELKKSHDKLLNELVEHSESNNRGFNSFINAVIKGLCFTMEEIKALKTEVSKARIQLIEPIIKGSGGVKYLQKAFTDRYGPPSNASVSLPSTVQWISSSRNTVEEEWNEHVHSFSILPAIDHAQPLVTTLRAGHGVPGGQLSTVSTADNMGLPACKGEKLDRLIRIGLLQLVSSMEGLQMQSVPETLKLNWLRLRSLQSQFQQVIVISTSMLVLHQVLVSENSKITPPELENVGSELFETLTKLLDNFPDVGSNEIIEVMMHSSTSSSSSSDKTIEARKQIITRVFLKSLQTGDTILKKVSRSVYCAFRAIMLGGSGAKGRKLADAALRRIGATKLTDRVVKAAEVLIKAALLSQQIHGPWYQHLM